MARPRLLLLPVVLIVVATSTLSLAQEQQVTRHVDVDVDVVGGDQVAAALDDAAHATTQTKTKTTTVTITRARVAATFEATRIAGSGVSERALPASAEALEQCNSGGAEAAQCAQEPARALPTEDAVDQQRPANNDVLHVLAQHQQAALDVAARHLQEIQDRVDEWLPKLQAALTSIIDAITRVWQSVAAAWRAFARECTAFYDRFLADTVDALTAVYHHVAVVAYDVYSVVRDWIELMAAQARVVWETHEEVRVVTRHAVSLLLLGALGAAFLSMYALAATVPDTVSAMWTSLDDLTRAQLKIVLALLTGFTVYHLRALWSFWLLLGSVVTFYYWSGHVLAKTMKPVAAGTPLSRQASARDASSAKLKTY